MTTDNPETVPRVSPLLRALRRKNVLAGLLFIVVAALGLWLSRHYPVGTALRMSTGYVPRLLCWVLMALGGVARVQGLRERDAAASDRSPPAGAEPAPPGVLTQLRPIAMVTLGLVAFALALEPLGLVLAIFILFAVASLATRDLKLWETLAAAAGMSVLTWVIFILGLGLPISVWPDW
jgi:hypothetical protein